MVEQCCSAQLAYVKLSHTHNVLLLCVYYNASIHAYTQAVHDATRLVTLCSLLLTETETLLCPPLLY